MADEEYQSARFEPRKAAERDPNEVPPDFWIGDEYFVCQPRSLMPVGILRRLSSETWTVARTCEFIEAVLEDKDLPDDETPTQIERFRATLDRKDVIVDNELLTKIVVWVIGAVSQRPTSSPSGSTGGQKATKAGSKAKRSGPGLRSAV